MVFVDTNVVLRWLLDDHPLSKQAKLIVAKANPGQLFVSGVILAEIIYVFGGLGKNRLQVHAAFELLRSTPAFSFWDSVFADKTMGLLLHTKLDFADCYLIASALKSGGDLQTFDNAMMKKYESLKG